MKISEVLKSLREESGLTQAQLGKLLGVGQATIAAYENEKREPHIFSLIAYADFFECSIDYIVGRADDFGNIVLTNGASNRMSLTPEEIKVIEQYRSLSKSERMKVMGYMEGLKS